MAVQDEWWSKKMHLESKSRLESDIRRYNIYAIFYCLLQHRQAMIRN